MSTLSGLKAADIGWHVDDIVNASDYPLYKSVKLEWSMPILWRKGQASPTKSNDSCIYILMHDHGNADRKKSIKYVGLTDNPSRRFLNHPTAHDIVSRRGQAYVSFSFIKFVKGRNRIARLKQAMEEIEHILIWTLNPPENDRKRFTLPGMGKNRGNAWHIYNGGYRFHGQVPMEIVFPWFLFRLGRDRSAK